MRFNLQAQGICDIIKHVDEVEEHKDMMAIVAIYQVVPEDVLLMLAGKDSPKVVWETL